MPTKKILNKLGQMPAKIKSLYIQIIRNNQPETMQNIAKMQLHSPHTCASIITFEAISFGTNIRPMQLSYSARTKLTSSIEQSTSKPNTLKKYLAASGLNGREVSLDYKKITERFNTNGRSEKLKKLIDEIAIRLYF